MNTLFSERQNNTRVLRVSRVCAFFFLQISDHSRSIGRTVKSISVFHSLPTLLAFPIRTSVLLQRDALVTVTKIWNFNPSCFVLSLFFFFKKHVFGNLDDHGQFVESRNQLLSQVRSSLADNVDFSKPHERIAVLNTKWKVIQGAVESQSANLQECHLLLKHFDENAKNLRLWIVESDLSEVVHFHMRISFHFSAAINSTSSICGFRSIFPFGIPSLL